VSFGSRRRLAAVAGLIALVATVAAVLAVLRPDWLEGLFAFDPDAGDGSLELALTVGMFLVAALLGMFSVFTLERHDNTFATTRSRRSRAGDVAPRMPPMSELAAPAGQFHPGRARKNVS
jgi:hypothetical protein